MNISSPSFGKKIPIISAKIQDNETGKFESATVYKVDCADDSDVQDMMSLSDSWRFRNLIAKDMARKNHLIKYFQQDDEKSIYVLEDNQNRVLGIGEMEEVDEAYSFYTDVCGFEDYYGYFLRMNPSQINQFIEQTEERTQSMFIDLRG